MTDLSKAVGPCATCTDPLHELATSCFRGRDDHSFLGVYLHLPFVQTLQQPFSLHLGHTITASMPN